MAEAKLVLGCCLPANRLMRKRMTFLMARNSLGNSHTISKMKMTSNIRKITGCCSAAHKPANTAISSAMEEPQLEKGSGEVLISTRVPALVKCFPASIHAGDFVCEKFHHIHKRGGRDD